MSEKIDTKTKLLGTLSTLGPLGRKLPAPGTWGSVAGIVFYWFAFQGINSPQTLLQFVIWAALLVVVAVPVCEAGEKYLGKTDPGEVNFDEFAVMPICFAGLGEVIASSANTLYWLLAGFVLFRLFDIFKPLFIKKLQNLNGGWGVVADDFAAAALTCVCLWAAHWIFPNI
ncbi:MAG: phosphatidylglycerophosphatase A [Opitutales bacterium]|nr:phosphatidylglycerophosphatase A [Opitutales bacterium]